MRTQTTTSQWEQSGRRGSRQQQRSLQGQSQSEEEQQQPHQHPLDEAYATSYESVLGKRRTHETSSEKLREESENSLTNDDDLDIDHL